MTVSSTFKQVTTIVSISGVTTLNIFVQGALTVSITSIGKDLGAKESNLQWPINVFSLAFASLLLFFGRLGDVIGHRTVFLCGTAWFALWSLVSAFAPNYPLFIFFMALTGVGVAANTPAAIGLCISQFPAGVARNNALGFLGGGQPLGFFLGLILGGVLSGSSASWRAIFYVQAALAVAFIALGFSVLKNDMGSARYSLGLDYGGVFLSVSSIGLLIFTIASGTSASRGWATPYIIALFLLSIVLLAAFVFLENYRHKNNKSVLIPFDFTAKINWKVVSILLTSFFGWWSFNTLIYYLTLYLQQVQHLHPLPTGFRYIPTVLSGIILNIATGIVMNRLDGQLLIVVGIIGNTIAALLYALINVNASYWEMAFFIMLLNPFCDVLYPTGTLLLTSLFDEDSQALAGGIFNVAISLGSSVGLAVTSSVATSVRQKYMAQNPELLASSSEVLLKGFRAAGWTCFGASCAATVIAIAGLRGIGIIAHEKVDNEDGSSIRTTVVRHSMEKEKEKDGA